MSPWQRRDAAFLTVLAAGLVLVLGHPVHADTNRIGPVSQDRTAAGPVLSFTYTSDQPVTDLSVTVDGSVTPATVRPLTATSPIADRSAVLVIDTSGSMTGDGIASARAAALSFVDAMPADVRVGLVTAGQPARTLLAPTRDRAATRSAIARLTASGETCLYDAVGMAVSGLGGHGNRLVVVLSDGADTRSRVPLPAAQSTVRTSGVGLDAVGFRTSEAVDATLRALAQSGGGQVVRAQDTRAVTAAFLGSGRKLTSELAVTVQLPKRLAGRTVGLSVTPVGATAAVAATTTVQLLPALVRTAPAPAASVGFWRSPAGLGLGLGLLFLAIAVAVLVVGEARGRRRAREAVEAYHIGSPPPGTAATADGGRTEAAALRFAASLSSRLGLRTRLATQLDAAGARMSVEEYVLALLLAAVVVAAGVAVLTGSVLSGALLGLGAAVLCGWLWLDWRVRRRRGAFVDALPDSLHLVASSLTAGFSLPQALDGLARRGTEPVAGEVGRALATARLGVGTEDALDAVAERMRCPDLAWTVMAIRVQREIGGNLAELLRTVAETLRERGALQRHVRALSAEARLSTRILLALPVLLALYEFLVRRDYIRVLYTEPRGILLGLGTVVWMVVGVLWMRTISRIEV